MILTHLAHLEIAGLGAPPDYFDRLASAFHVDATRISRHNRGIADHMAAWPKG
jgi:hypothetical protein